MDCWYFANDRGESEPVGETELRGALREGRIDSTCLVWRVGWKDWMQAQHVRQFSKTLGERARDAKDPSIDLKQKTPPALPPREPALEHASRLSTPVPPVHRQKPLVRRPPVPTITEDPSLASGGTLRPPGAVPPPPRAVPRTLLSEGEDFDSAGADMTDAMHSVPPFQLGSAQRPSVASMRHAATSFTPVSRKSSSARQDPATDAIAEMPTEELSTPQQANTDLPISPYDPDSSDQPHSTPNLHVEAPPRLRLPFRSRRLPRVLIGLSAILLTVGTFLTLRRPSRIAAPTPIENSSRIAAKPLVCVAARAAQRIAPQVLLSVAPIAAESAVAGRMLVGFAENPTTATGITVDPTDLDVRLPFREAKEQRIISVAPLLIGGNPGFFAARENQALRQARAIDADQDFLLGLADTGIARQPLGSGGAIETLWAVDSKTAVTDPRVSSISGQGHAVTFRQGGQTGAIMLGWLAENGRALAGPFQVKTKAGLLGTPTLATGTAHAMVAFAGRSSESQPWSIHISRAELGQPPASASEFTQPVGGAGGDAIAPSMVALPNRQWLLQWSEGPQGQRQVRVQTLDPEGRPVGLSHTVSPVGSNSGQGLLWSIGHSAVSLFVVNVGRSAELWATPITCNE